MKNIIKLARQTVDGLRALPKIGQILTERSDERGLAVDLATAQERLGSALDVYRAALAEAKARIATLVESDGQLRLERDDLTEHVVELRNKSDRLTTALQSANFEITRLKSDLKFWIRAKSDR